MPVRYTSDRRGPKQGVPYDALQTILDGKGKWWERMDPVDLYGPPHTIPRGPRRPENDPLVSPFANQFMWRVDDAITKYRPDVIYFDEHAGDSQVDLGVHMGLGFLGPQLAANYYNKSLKWNDGRMEAVLNLTQHGRGDLDPEVVRIAKDIGAWLKVNGDAVYASRPFEVFGEDAVRYTRNKGNVYATLLKWNGGSITLKALRTGGVTLGNVSKVELLGSDAALTFVQNEQGLTVTSGGPVPPLAGISNQALASTCRVLRIAHDKGWFNDDDPGAKYPGWLRRCTLGTGDFNNDLTISDTAGDVWSSAFTGSSVAVVAPKEPGAGKIEIQVDGDVRATVDLSTSGERQVQQTVSEISGLAPGKHSINIVNRGPGPVAVDALIVR